MCTMHKKLVENLTEIGSSMEASLLLLCFARIEEIGWNGHICLLHSSHCLGEIALLACSSRLEPSGDAVREKYA